LATVAAVYWPRDFSSLPPATNRLFEVEPGTRLLAKCHWQESPRLHDTMVLVHGLEGSSESPYMLGIAERAFQRGFNVLRMNQRNCGGTEHLTPTLCHSGLSEDYRTVLSELIECDQLPEIFFSGYSTGGNLVLKMAGELAERTPRELRGICAVSPCVDLAACADGSGHRRNLVYESYFLRSMRNTLQRKAALFPERYQAERSCAPRSVREWDEAITAPEWGYRDAADYYDRVSALHVIGRIRVPTLILAAEDDPLVPIASFRNPGIEENPFITLVAPEHGGHCAFISSEGGNERFWPEECVIEFCTSRSVS
jgi:predicted alpha/beta-fold hydrolase